MLIKDAHQFNITFHYILLSPLVCVYFIVTFHKSMINLKRIQDSIWTFCFIAEWPTLILGNTKTSLILLEE